VCADAGFNLQESGAQLASVDATLSIPGFVAGRDSLGAQPLARALDVECPDVARVISMFEPSWTKASGVLSAHVAPVGTAGDFRLSGRVALENARVDLPSGLRLRDAQMTLVSDGNGTVSMDGAVTSGGGRVVVKASSARSEKGWLKGSFTARGERFQAVNQPEAQVFISPDLDVQLAGRVAFVTGRVGVPYARIETAEVPATAASTSNDVVFVEDTLATKTKWQVKTQVRVELGDSVTFNGFGLRARLAGSLAVDDERGRPTRGTGEIQIMDGRYRAFGNELRIDPGRFVFGGGPIDNPGLDIRAYRGLTTQNVMAASSGEIVGMKLFGTLRRPEFSVFSNPPMSQSEIMSYLVMGRPLTTGDDQSALANAALMLGMQQGGGMMGDVGKKFSIDEVYFDAGSDIKETSFVAGKYLSPKLYVSYATGLFENTNTFRARYSLTSKWTLQTESGKESGTDLLYWFEQGK
jgi:translocation and assembly module TamB